MLFITTLAIYDQSKFPEGSRRIHCKYIEGSRGAKMLKDVKKMFSEDDYIFLQTTAMYVTLVDKSAALYNTLLSSFPNLHITQDYESYAPVYVIDAMNRATNFVLPVATGVAVTQPTNLPSCIAEGIYLGTINDALSERVLERLNIGAVINCTKSLEFTGLEDIEKYRFAVNDHVSDNISQFFDEASDLIERLRLEKKRILIHCAAGVSRSPTILAAYFMKTRGMNWRDAVQFIRDSRPCVDPNLGFSIQLEHYGESLSVSKL